jgi:thioredoxin-related protein
MKSLLVMSSLCVSLFVQAQVAGLNAQSANTPINSTIEKVEPGIVWVDNLNWQQVRKKAKKENKYIFVDCHATWCKPCKQMDKEVYANDSVGDLLNANFISVKVQMDSAKADNEQTKSWYKTAREIGATYRVAAYPTFLFFSPDGELVYKEFGYKAPDQFVQIARDALNPSKQYYVLLKAYKKGKKDFAHMPDLIRMSKQLGDSANYLALLTDYYTYLNSLDKDKLYTKENIEFIASTLDKPNQSPFSMFYPDGSAVDKVMEKDGYAQKVADRVIFKEKANPFLSAAEGKAEPDWSILYNNTAKDYKADYADRTVLDAKMRWYYFYGNMQKYATALNDKIERYGSDTTSSGEDFKLNNQAFLIWQQVKDIAELKRIIGWMTGVVRRGEKATGFYTEYWPYYMDTYANLLYKVGETAEALKWQELAVAKGKERGIDKGTLKTIEENLEMMKKGEPTWPTDTK